MPINIRSLADSIAMLHEDQLPVTFDTDFLIMLDVDVCDNDNNSRVVNRYECEWWKGRKPRSLDLVEILDASSVSKCLEVHQTELASIRNGDHPDIPHPSFNSTMPTPPRSITMAGSNVCRHCAQYSHILSGALEDLLDVHRFANSMSASSESQWNIDMRRASTFNLLHEAAVLKETASSSSASSLTPAPDLINSVAESAKRELDRLQALPPTSHKWTWGEKLSEDEVRALRRSMIRQPHSGYNISLKPGQVTGEESPNPSVPTYDGVHDELPSQHSAPRDNFLQSLKYFKNHDHLTYDPLGKIRDKMSNSDQDIDLADQWSTASKENRSELDDAIDTADSTNIALDIADQWSSDSERNGPAKENACIPASRSEGQQVQSDQATDFADTWSSADDDIQPEHVQDNILVLLSSKRGNQSDTSIADAWSSVGEANETRADIADDWVSDGENDDTVAGDIAEVWSSASDDDDTDANRPQMNIADDWSSAHECDEEPISSQPTVDSQMAVSPSSITIDTSRNSFLPFGDWPSPGPDGRHLNSTSTSIGELQGGNYLHSWGPEHFKFLHEPMFVAKKNGNN